MKNLEDNKVLVEITITVFEKDETYEIVYHFNGGTPHPNTVYTYRKDQLPLILLEPTLSGYRFLGWYKDENLLALILLRFHQDLLEKNVLCQMGRNY